jgi:phosphoglycolate phosphatase
MTANAFCEKEGCVLFDLDGTLLDSAPDIVGAINEVYVAHGKPMLSMEQLRPISGEGTSLLIETGFGYPPNEEELNQFRKELFACYQARNNANSSLFTGIDAILSHFNAREIPWGIVTNKPTSLTLPLLERFPILQTAGIIVCADTLSKAKPHPEPIWHACEKLKREPQKSIYIGDHERDAIAGKAAGLFVVVALYGYIMDNHSVTSWPADHRVNSVQELANLLI